MDWRIGSRADATFIEAGWVKPTECSLIYVKVKGDSHQIWSGRDIHGFLPRYPSFVNLVAVTFHLPYRIQPAKSMLLCMSFNSVRRYYTLANGGPGRENNQKMGQRL